MKDTLNWLLVARQRGNPERFCLNHRRTFETSVSLCLKTCLLSECG
jgi:hypothetical protein